MVFNTPSNKSCHTRNRVLLPSFVNGNGNSVYNTKGTFYPVFLQYGMNFIIIQIPSYFLFFYFILYKTNKRCLEVFYIVPINFIHFGFFIFAHTDFKEVRFRSQGNHFHKVKRVIGLPDFIVS
jgi:hypothetical protein